MNLVNDVVVIGSICFCKVISMSWLVGRLCLLIGIVMVFFVVFVLILIWKLMLLVLCVKLCISLYEFDISGGCGCVEEFVNRLFNMLWFDRLEFGSVSGYCR